jgi:predicted RNA-binding protein Jag
VYNLTEPQAPRDNMEDIRETQQAISAVLNGERWVDLPPGPSLVRRLQHELARNAELVSHSYGKEPRRHVRILGNKRLECGLK